MSFRHQCLSHEHLGIIEGLLCYLRLHHHALGCILLEYPDDLEVERWADPHGIGVDQFFADIGSTIASYCSFNSTEVWSLFNEFVHQVFCSIQSEPQVWLVFGLITCCLVQIIQTVASFGVFTDGDGVKVEKKAPRINYVGFIAPLITLVSSWIHA